MKNLPKRLRELREGENLTYVDLYFKTGVKDTTLNSWEMGHNIPRIDKLAKLARFYGVSLDWLAGITKLKYIENKWK